MKNLFNALILFLLISCDSKTKEDNPIQYININLGDHTEYKYMNDKGGIEGFVFSPVDSNKVWILDGNSFSYELNILDSTISEIPKAFGKYIKKIKAEDILKDPIDENLIWFCNFHEGLLVYDMVEKKVSVYESVKPISAIKFLKTHILFGTWEGLFRFDREEKSLFRSTQIASIKINLIEKINESTVRINSIYEYNYLSDTIIETLDIVPSIYAIREIEDVKIITTNEDELIFKSKKNEKQFHYNKKYIDNIIVDENEIWIPGINLANGIEKYSLKDNSSIHYKIGCDVLYYKVFNDIHHIWFIRKDELIIFDKTDFSSKFYPLNFSINWLAVDSKYLYLSSYKGFHVFNKNYVLSQAIDVDKKTDIEKEFNEVYSRQGLINTQDFKEYYEFYCELKSKFDSSNNNRIKEKINHLKIYFKQKNLPYNVSELNKLITYCEDSVYDEEIKASLYLRAFQISCHQGELELAVMYDSILIKNHPEVRNRWNKNKGDMVLESHLELNEVYKNNYSRDEHLWRVGKLYFNLFGNAGVGPVGGGMKYEMNYPFSFFDSLLTEYPGSEFADDAEFLMFEYNEVNIVGYNVAAIDKYKELLKKYPNTNCRARSYDNMSEIYFHGCPSYEEKPSYLELSKKYAEKILNEFPDYEGIKSVKKRIEEIEKEYLKALWKLEICAEKDVYNSDEPVNISFTIRNIDDEAKAIKIMNDKSIPSFVVSIDLYSSEPYVYREHLKLERFVEAFNNNMTDTIIQPNHIYEERWDIKKNARNSYYNAPGKYRFGKGRYEIKASATMNNYQSSIFSNSIWINVE